jgi:hypothetical protein
MNVHGGVEDSDIITFMNNSINVARNISENERIIVFLDEINTCNCMGLFKEIVCDRSMNGINLPDNIKIIAACNPYRLRNKEDAGIYLSISLYIYLSNTLYL